MKYTLAFNKENISFELENKHSVDIIKPRDIQPLKNPQKAATEALKNVTCQTVFKKSSPLPRRVSIAITDKTRPVPLHLLLSPLLKELKAAGISNKNISIIAATGTHEPMPIKDILTLLPDNLEPGYKIFSHNCDDTGNLTFLGVTQRGVNVLINSTFIDADTKIVIGNIEPHHFMGFSGGVKCAAIGLAGRDTICRNHEMLKDPNSTTGVFSANPMRQDIEEIGEMIGIDLAINAVINTKKETAAIFAGTPQDVIHSGISFLNQYCQVQLSKKYDLVIASSGGYPKDINLYQSQKGLTNAAAITKDKGTVILAAACSEGIGSPGLDLFMRDVHSPEEIFSKFDEEGFSIGPHKAFLIARQLSRINVYLISHLSRQETERMLFLYEENIQKVLQNLDTSINIAIMPNAVITVPNFI